MNVTPGLLNGPEQLMLLKARRLDLSLADTAIAITDTDHRFYEIPSPTWPRSNPRGYLKWFHSRMAAIFELRKRELMRKSLRGHGADSGL